MYKILFYLFLFIWIICASTITAGPYLTVPGISHVKDFDIVLAPLEIVDNLKAREPGKLRSVATSFNKVFKSRIETGPSELFDAYMMLVEKNQVTPREIALLKLHELNAECEELLVGQYYESALMRVFTSDKPRIALHKLLIDIPTEYFEQFDSLFLFFIADWKKSIPSQEAVIAFYEDFLRMRNHPRVTADNFRKRLKGLPNLYAMLAGASEPKTELSEHTDNIPVIEKPFVKTTFINLRTAIELRDFYGAARLLNKYHELDIFFLIRFVLDDPAYAYPLPSYGIEYSIDLFRELHAHGLYDVSYLLILSHFLSHYLNKRSSEQLISFIHEGIFQYIAALQTLYFFTRVDDSSLLELRLNDILSHSQRLKVLKGIIRDIESFNLKQYKKLAFQLLSIEEKQEIEEWRQLIKKHSFISFVRKVLKEDIANAFMDRLYEYDILRTGVTTPPFIKIPRIYIIMRDIIGLEETEKLFQLVHVTKIPNSKSFYRLSPASNHTIPIHDLITDFDAYLVSDDPSDSGPDVNNSL